MGPTDGLPPKFHYRWLESKFTEVMENFCINFGSSYKFLLKKKKQQQPSSTDSLSPKQCVLCNL